VVDGKAQRREGKDAARAVPGRPRGSPSMAGGKWGRGGRRGAWGSKHVRTSLIRWLAKILALDDRQGRPPHNGFLLLHRLHRWQRLVCRARIAPLHLTYVKGLPCMLETNPNTLT